jgi:hypothetical protein
MSENYAVRDPFSKEPESIAPVKGHPGIVSRLY